MNRKNFIKVIFSFTLIFFVTSLLFCSSVKRKRVHELGLKIGILKHGKYNAITDVQGVRVGHYTLIKGENIRTGVTAIIPHEGNIFQDKVPAAIYVANGFGKLIGYTQIEELGNIETPIILTNTLSVPVAADALIDYILSLKENKDIKSINPVVGETNDGWLNDIAGRYIKREHVIKAINTASLGFVEEGAVGAGTGTICFGYKGGIGTSSRILPSSLGGYTVGVLVQTNFGGILQIAGCAIGIELGKYYLRDKINSNPDGSCMIVVATDAPLSSRNLKRLAKRAMLGLAKTGGISSNGSGDYVIAFSTGKSIRIPYKSKSSFVKERVLRNEKLSPLFLAVIEATEEAILNSFFMANSMKGNNGLYVEAIPINEVMKILKKYNKVK